MKQVKVTKIEKKYKTKDGQTKTLEINYAKVADRLSEFRSANPRSKISVKFAYDEAGNLTHHAYIWKDKTDFYELLKSGISAKEALESADAEGSSLMYADKVKAEKGFEKNETIAIGRALAILGYSSSGDIASSEEMEEFEDFKRQKKEDAKADAIEKITKAKTMKDLLAVWKSLSKDQQLDKDVQARKDAKKGELNESSKDSAK